MTESPQIHGNWTTLYSLFTEWGKKEIKDFLVFNKNGGTMYPNLWHTVVSMIRKVHSNNFLHRYIEKYWLKCIPESSWNFQKESKHTQEEEMAGNKLRTEINKLEREPTTKLRPSYLGKLTR